MILRSFSFLVGPVLSPDTGPLLLRQWRCRCTRNLTNRTTAERPTRRAGSNSYASWPSELSSNCCEQGKANPLGRAEMTLRTNDVGTNSFKINPRTKEVAVEYVVVAMLSVALLLTVVTLIRERRLRLALQEILRRIMHRWRSHGQK